MTITNAATATTRETVTGPDGTFLFPDLLAGTYDLKAGLSGFKTYEQKGIVLSSTDRVALRAITLERRRARGNRDRSRATSPLVQTSTGARSGVIERQQMEDLALKGRDFAGYLKLLPGVIDTRNREAPGWENMNNLSINGRTSFNFSYDGVTNKDTGQNGAQFRRPGARFDRGNQGADVEFPGRIRPQLWRHDHRRHAQRLEGLPRDGGVLQARPGVQRQRIPAPPAMRLGSNGAVRRGALHLR